MLDLNNYSFSWQTCFMWEVVVDWSRLAFG